MKNVLKRILVAALIFSLLSLSFFIVANLHHDHDSEYCHVCVRIESAVNILRGLALGVSLVFCCANVMPRASQYRGASADGKVSFETPLLLKVKLNN